MLVQRQNTMQRVVQREKSHVQRMCIVTNQTLGRKKTPFPLKSSLNVKAFPGTSLVWGHFGPRVAHTKNIQEGIPSVCPQGTDEHLLPVSLILASKPEKIFLLSSLLLALALRRAYSY